MDRYLLVASTLCFLLGFARTMFALGAGHYHYSRFNFAVIACGFALQTAFLYSRGQEHGRCPITNMFEVIIFMAWSIALIYLLIGTAYRISLLGTFTSPLVFALQVIALISPIDQRRTQLPQSNGWLEVHAALSLIAYGTFGLACVAGVMYLVQERQLKTHHIHSIFYHLPPINQLGMVNNRLLLLGFTLLTTGLAAGFLIDRPLHWADVGSALGVWIVYGAILQARWWKALGPRRIAALSVIAFSLTLGTLWGISVFSSAHRM